VLALHGIAHGAQQDLRAELHVAAGVQQAAGHAGHLLHRPEVSAGEPGTDDPGRDAVAVVTVLDDTSVRATRACLLAQQAASPGTTATPASLPMLMIRPNRRACIAGRTPAPRQAAARTSTAKMRSHPANAVSSTGFHTA
jgi:hypothetical protein